MSAIDYLRQLQASMPYSGGIPEGILKQRREQLKDYADFLTTYEPSLENTEKFFREKLVAPFLACIPSDEARNLHDTPVGLLPIYEPNAWAIQTPSNDHLIVLHGEMLAVLSFYNEVKAATQQIYQQHGMDKATSFNRDCFRIIFDSFLHKRSADFPPLPIKLDERLHQSVQLMTCANELFIIAHEFAHIALGHTGKVHAVSLKGIGGLTQVSKVMWEQQQELDADLKAFKWLHQLDRNSESIFIRFAALSPTICAEVLMLIHFLEAYIGFPDSTSSHPPALVRMKHIFSHAHEIMSEFDKSHFAEMIQRAEVTDKLEF